MIGVIGLNHKTAPVEIREKYSIDNQENINLARKISSASCIDEVVILSTCNRTEIYFTADEQCFSEAFIIIERKLYQFVNQTNTDQNVLIPYLYRHNKKEAVRHLFRVISSLDSLVLGEYQIVSQVKEAYRLAREAGTIGRVFKRLFIKALETGKLVRTKTAMSVGAFSVSYAAVEKCQKYFNNLKQKKILLIGAGETGELVIKNLCKKGCHNITITNRTHEKAQLLANRYNGKTIKFADFMENMNEMEIVISSVSGKNHLFDADKLRPFLNEHPMLMIDLGIPRNINPDVSDLPNITLLNIDDLEEVVAANLEKKQNYITTAEDIIDDKVDEFSDWLNTQNLSPAIQDILYSISKISEQGLAAQKAYFPKETHQLLEQHSNLLSEKLTGTLIKNLKAISDNGRKTEYAKMIKELFYLPDEE